MPVEQPNLVPVVASLCGGFLTLLGSFGTTWFNQGKVERLAKEDRQRKRLEEIYTTLIAIRSSYYELSTKVSSKVFNDVPIETYEFPEMPQILKLEMIIDLYFPELKGVHNDFINTKNIFGTKYIEVVLTNYKNESIESRQNTFAKTFELLTDVDNSIKLIRMNVSKIIKV